MNTVPKASANIFCKTAVRGGGGEDAKYTFGIGQGTNPTRASERDVARSAGLRKPREKIREREKEREREGKAVRSETYSKVVGSFVLPQGGTNSAEGEEAPFFIWPTCYMEKFLDIRSYIKGRSRG